MNISCMIIDDEPLAGNLMEEYVNRIPYLNLQNKSLTALEALDFLKDHDVDLIFLDINMPALSGMQFARILSPKQKVIFTTAYTEYAVESYTVNAVDYLLKPVVFERFVQSVDKAAEAIKQSSGNATSAMETGSFFIKSGKAMVKVSYRRIHYIEGLKDYVVFQLEKERHIVYKKMKDLEEILPPNFARIHHSFFVNTDHIRKIEDNHVHILDARIPIGAKYKDGFITQVRSHLM